MHRYRGLSENIEDHMKTETEIPLQAKGVIRYANNNQKLGERMRQYLPQSFCKGTNLISLWQFMTAATGN